MSSVSWLAVAGLASVYPSAYPSKSTGLAGWIRMSIDNEPRLKARRSSTRAYEAEIGASASIPNPTVGYAYSPLAIETRLGPQRHLWSLKQRVPWPEQLSAEVEEARARAQVAFFEEASAARTVVARVGRAYAQLWAAEGRRNRTRSLRLSRVRALETSRSDLSLAKVSPKQTAEAELGLARIEAALAEAEGEVNDAQIQLRSSAGLAPEGSAEAIYLPKLPKSATRAGSHPDLSEAAARVRQARAALSSAEARRWPSFLLGVSWLEVGSGQAEAPDAGRDALVIQLEAALPIWIGPSQARIEAAANRVKAASNQARVHSIILEAKRARLDARALAQSHRLERFEAEVLPAARRLLDIARADLAAGTSIYREVIENEEDLLELEKQAISIEANLFATRFERLALDLPAEDLLAELEDETK